MRQQINLLDTIPKSPRYILNERLTVIIMVAIISLLIIISCVQFFILEYKSYKIQTTQQALIEKSDALNKLLAQHKTEQVVSLKQEIAKKNNIIQMLYPNTPNFCSFSAYLRALGESKIGGVWLASIQVSFDKPEVTLKGLTLEPALVMGWLHTLSNTLCFSHQIFDHIELTKAATEEKNIPLQFSVSSSKLFKLSETAA